jgi:hypothetical protein
MGGEGREGNRGGAAMSVEVEDGEEREGGGREVINFFLRNLTECQHRSTFVMLLFWPKRALN